MPLPPASKRWHYKEMQIDPEHARNLFFLGQLLMGAIFIGGWIWLRGQGRQSSFRVRESDRPKPTRAPGSAPGKDELANARLDLKKPLLLSGIRLEGPPYEILGVGPKASEAEIQKAYRELMKRYHPDRVGRPGTREWTDAQKIAEAINRAKEEMLKRARGA